MLAGCSDRQGRNAACDQLVRINEPDVIGSHANTINYQREESAGGVGATGVVQCSETEAKAQQSGSGRELLRQSCSLLKGRVVHFSDVVLSSIHATQGPSGNNWEAEARGSVRGGPLVPSRKATRLEASVG